MLRSEDVFTARALVPYVTFALLACPGCGKEEPASPGAPAMTSPKAVAAAKASDGDLAHQHAECRACRQLRCTNYEGEVDLLASCFAHSDPEFVRRCTAARNCAYRNKCGYNSTGAPECFCGTADVESCQQPGTANGPCQAEWYAAALTDSLSELAERFGDLSFPSGVAHYLQQCDHDFCKACRP